MRVNVSTKFNVGDLVHLTANRIMAEREGDGTPFVGQIVEILLAVTSTGHEVRYAVAAASPESYEGEFVAAEVALEPIVDVLPEGN